MPRAKKTRKERSKPFKIDNERYLREYFQFVAKGGTYWDDWHKRCVDVFSYREEEVDGDLVFYNEDNEGAKLTLASVKSRFTRLEKKWNAALTHPDNKDVVGQMDSRIILPKLKTRAKTKSDKKPPINFAALFKLADTVEVLEKATAEQLAELDGE